MSSAGDGSSNVRTISEAVELSIPVQSDLIILARLTAATVASRAGFDVEEVDDLRLAVDELCVLVIDGAGTGRLDLSFIASAGGVEVTCRLDESGAADEEHGDDHGERDLSVRILEALADEHGVVFEQGQRSGWLRKWSVRHQRS